MTTNITEITIRNSGEVVLVEETAVGNSLALSRRSIFPGDDYSAEVPRVQSICDVVHTEAYLGLPINPAALADWTNFNLTMIPPTAESTFEVWLGQFKEPYRAALAVASSEGNTEKVQGQYEILKDLASPTAEQIAEWQGIADRHNIGLTF